MAPVLAVDTAHQLAIRYAQTSDWPNALFYARVLNTHTPSLDSLVLYANALFHSSEHTSCFHLLHDVQPHTLATVILFAKSAIKLGVCVFS
jgi:hypothetical protein